MNESRKKYKFELPHNQKFSKYGEITHTDETWTIRGSNKDLLLPQIFLGEAIANSLLAGAPPMIKAINQKKFPSICINPKRELHR